MLELPTKIPKGSFIVDFQGYNTKKKFYFKEFAIYNHDEKTIRNYFCKTPRINGQTYRYLINYHHGIPHYFGNSNYKDVLNELQKAEFIFCKGENKRDILEYYLKNTPIINLEYFGCPKIRDLPSKACDCIFEKHQFNCFCSLKIIQSLKEWLTSIWKK